MFACCEEKKIFFKCPYQDNDAHSLAQKKAQKQTIANANNYYTNY